MLHCICYTVYVYIGYGEYKSAFGEVIKGCFIDGILNDMCGYMSNQVGEVYTGRFKEGELTGEGRYMNEKGHNYEGSFSYNLRHGRGIAQYKDEGVYKGYFIYDTFCGKGVLDYMKRPDDTTSTPTPAPTASTTNAAGESQAADPTTTSFALGDKMYKGAKKTATTTTTAATGTTTSNTNTTANTNTTNTTNTTTPTPSMTKPSKFLRSYHGYFTANQIMNGGYISNKQYNIEIPILISKVSKKILLPINKLIKKKQVSWYTSV